MTWAVRLASPGTVRRVEQAEEDRALRSGEVRLRFRAGGLCGSDMPLFHGLLVESVSGAHGGAPIHEIVGEVIESASTRLRVGQRVVGTGGLRAGLAEILVESDTAFIPVPEDFSDVEAVPIQSLATVIRAAKGLPDVAGKRVAVVGAGPIGLAFIHVLRTRGAGHITAIDPVERAGTATRFGADEFRAVTSTEWASGLEEKERPQIVIEAVGHQQSTIPDCLRAVASWGHVLGFGAADDDDYMLPYREMYERGLTLSSGRTLDGWVGVLQEGRDYLLRHRADFDGYVTHTFAVEDAQTAYDLYASTEASRLKVALVDNQPG